MCLEYSRAGGCACEYRYPRYSSDHQLESLCHRCTQIEQWINITRVYAHSLSVIIVIDVVQVLVTSIEHHIIAPILQQQTPDGTSSILRLEWYIIGE